MITHKRGAVGGGRFQIGIITFLLLLLLAVQGDAQGFRNPPEGAAALGRAGGKVVFSDDASAVSHNPANLVDLGEPQALAALTVLHAETDYDGPAGPSATTEEPWKFLPNLYGAWPVSGKDVVIAVGVTTPFGQSTEWDKSSPFRYTAPYLAQLVVVNVNPSAAVKLGDRLSIGAGLDIFVSDLDLKQVVPWSLLTGLPLPDGEEKICANGQGLGANLGLTWQVADHQRLALTFRTPVRVDYEGDFEAENLPAPAQLPPPLRVATAKSDFETDIEFPAVAALGYGIQVSDQLRCEANVEWIGFSSYDSLPLDAGPNAVLLPAAEVRQDWDDVWTFGIGADWRLDDRLTLRAGYLFIESPIPDETFSPTLPDADRHALSIGVGYRQGANALDLAYVYSLFEERDIRSNQNPAYDGEYDTASHILGVSWSRVF